MCARRVRESWSVKVPNKSYLICWITICCVWARVCLGVSCMKPLVIFTCDLLWLCSNILKFAAGVEKTAKNGVSGVRKSSLKGCVHQFNMRCRVAELWSPSLLPMCSYHLQKFCTNKLCFSKTVCLSSRKDAERRSTVEVYVVKMHCAPYRKP